MSKISLKDLCIKDEIGKYGIPASSENFDENKIRHTPREWFIAPLEVIEQSIQLIINGEIVNYKYDIDSKVIINR